MSWFGRLLGRRQEDEYFDDPAATDLEATVVAEPAVPSRGIRLPRFQGTASDSVRGGLSGKLEHIRFRLRNSFTPSRPVLDAEMFAGRRGLLSNIIRSIEDQQLHVVLFGARGIGKTSTLHILCQIAKDARYVVRYASCGERVSFDGMFRAILEDIPLLYHADYEPTADEIEEGLTFGNLVGDAPLTVSQVSEILSRISGTRLLLVLDEFDRVQSAEFRQSIAELIKNLSDRASRVQLVIAGVASNLNDIIEQIPSIRRNILGIPVPVMTEKELLEMIGIGEKESGLHFSPDAAQLICQIACGLPYLMGLVSLHAGLSAVDRVRIEVSELDVWIAVRQAFEEIDLRIAPDTRHQLDSAVKAGHGDELILLTRSALQAGGLVIPGQIDASAGKANVDVANLDLLSRQFSLLTPLVKDPQNAYIFTDEGAPLYFWMRGADQRAAASIAATASISDIVKRTTKPAT
jgi:hypothetical protein